MSEIQNDVYRVPLSRLPLLLFLSIASLFVFVGLDLSVLHVLFPDFQINPGKIIVFYAFLFFAVVIGSIIAVQMVLYIVKPPIMFEVSSEGIAFGTGFRYTLYLIPWKYVDTIGAGIDMPGLAVNKKLIFGVMISIKQSNEIPGDMATSIGVKYEYNTLYLHWMYLGRPAKEVIATIEAMKKRHT
jgi:hypothetical protein